MWISLFFAYCMFCTNWLIFSKMTGDSSKSTGWAVTFPEIATGVAAESVNFSITIASGIFTIPASYMLLKLGFRKACLMACGLVTVSLPLIFSPHWTVLILGSLVMAAGGTLTIIYMSPLLSKLVLPEKSKKLAAWNGFTFALSGLLVNLLFMISPVSTFLTQNWKWTSSITALFSFVPLIVFYLNGKDFEMVSLKEKLTVSKPENYFTLLSEKEAWMWILAYSCLLVVSVLFSSFVPKKLSEMIGSVKQLSSDSNNGGGSNSSLVDWKSLFTVVFFSGTCFGLYFLGKLNLTQIQSTSIVKCSLNLMLVTWVFMAGAATLMHYLGSYSYVFWLTNVIIFVGAFFLSFSGLGIQSVLLFIPLEYKNYSTQKTAIFFSCLWGMGYIILTGYYIFASVLSKYAGNLSSLCFLTALITCFYLAACKLSESSPEYVDLTEYFSLSSNSSFATQASMNVQELSEVKGLEEKSFKSLMYLLLLHNKTPIKYVGTTS